MTEMKIGYSGKYPYVEINLSLDEEVENNSVKLRMSKMWYKDIIYEIEKVAEEEKQCAEKYLHEGNRKMMNHSFDIYLKISEISQDLRRSIEMDSDVLTLREVSGGL
jgi:hypothetical protein